MTSSKVVLTTAATVMLLADVTIGANGANPLDLLNPQERQALAVQVTLDRAGFSPDLEEGETIDSQVPAAGGAAVDWRNSAWHGFCSGSRSTRQ